MEKRRVFVATVGDSTDPATRGGSPYYLQRAGHEAGFISGGLKLDTRGYAWKFRRGIWNFKALVSTGQFGGYQYSEAFLSELWRQAPEIRSGDILINYDFALFPKRISDDPTLEKWLYIDMTLEQLFDYYQSGKGLPRAVKNKALECEKEQHRQVTGIIAHNRWTANHLSNEYGFPSDKIHVAVPGANLDPDIESHWIEKESHSLSQRHDSRVKRNLRLVFVGKDWQRKGLSRLIGAFKIARQRKKEVELVVIGPQQEELPSQIAKTEGVVWAGYLSKRTQQQEFVELIGQCDIGCLLSHAEAGGICLREFHRLGLATIAPLTGGAPEYVLPGASDLVPPEATEEDIAEIICRLADNPDEVTERKRLSWEARETFGWDHTVRQIATFIDTTRRIQ
jgi:glycosyltransferase involved in cell wall biosynthesis